MGEDCVMLCIKIEDGRIAQVVDSEQPPQGFVSVPDSVVFVSDDVRYYDADWAPKPEPQLVSEGVIPPERTVYSVVTGEPKTVREFDVPDGFTLDKPEQGQVWDGQTWVTPTPEPLTFEQVQALRRAAYVAESDPLKNEADYDALINGTEPDYTAWMTAVEAIKVRYPLPEPERDAP